MLCKDGTYKWILDRGKIVNYDPDANPERMAGTHADLSETMAIKKPLKNAEKIQKTMAREA